MAKGHIWVERNTLLQVHPPGDFQKLREDEGFWYETPEEIDEGLAVGVRKEMLLQWVRRQMSRKLNRWERHCIRKHYFEGRSIKFIARRSKRNASAVRRTIDRAIRKLRKPACEEIWWDK